MTQNNAFNVFWLYEKMYFSQPPLAAAERREGEKERGENKEAKNKDA